MGGGEAVSLDDLMVNRIVVNIANIANIYIANIAIGGRWRCRQFG